jgi:hypothetical protein
MLTNLRGVHPTETPEVISTGGWVAQRILILATAVVSVAPFVLAYVGR